jgi:hypothetical protein
VLEEASIFGRDERLLDEFGNERERYVHSAHDLEAPHRPIVAIEDETPLVGLEALDVARRRAAIESAGAQPDIEEADR